MLTEKIIRYRWPVILIFLAITVFMALQLPKAHIQPDFESYIPETVPARQNTSIIEDIFGGTDVVMILLESDDVLNPSTLERVERLSRAAADLDGVEQVLSLFDANDIHGEEGTLVIDPAVIEIPRDSASREILRERLRNNELAYELVVADDFRTTALMLTLEQDVVDAEILAVIDSLLAAHPGNEKVRLGGMPEVRVSLQEDIAVDFILLLPAAMVLMVICLLIAFRQKRGVILPFLVVIMATVFSMGLNVLLGWELTILSILLPVMLIAIANDYGIHLVARYQELNNDGVLRGHNDHIRIMVESLGRPILLTGLTTIAGILCLQTHLLIPARRLGIAAAAGIAFALVLSIFFTPALFSFLQRPKPAEKRNGRFRLESWLEFFGRTIARHPRQIIVGAVLLTVLIASGIFYLKVDSNIINFFPDDHSTPQTADIINRHFGGSENLSILVTGDIKDPDLLKRMDDYERQLKEIPQVGNVSSLATVLRLMSRALNEPWEEGYDKIPSTRPAVAQYIELFNMSGDPDDLESIVDFDYENARMVVTMRDPDASAIQSVVDQAREITAGDANVKLFGGESLIVAELAQIVVRGQLISLGAAIIVIAIMMMILFRSFAAGILAMIPLGMAVTLLFGLMGIFRIHLDIATAMLTSIMIGVGVDYTIHFLWRYREELAGGLSYGDAVTKTILTTGRGITFNALSVIMGFSALLISTFPPIRFFGFLVVMSIFTCLVGALVLVPAVCMIWKPKFLEPS